ncbi:Ubiquitin fusion degradation protein 4 [Mortierella sp. GBA30]|nr:Ubiquitin fusion degradation protein 4 [Mortierella sp. GBA30]
MTISQTMTSGDNQFKESRTTSDRNSRSLQNLKEMELIRQTTGIVSTPPTKTLAKRKSSVTLKDSSPTRRFVQSVLAVAPSTHAITGTGSKRRLVTDTSDPYKATKGTTVGVNDVYKNDEDQRSSTGKDTKESAARQDYITFASGIGGDSSFASSSSPSTGISSSSQPLQSTRKRNLLEATQKNQDIAKGSYHGHSQSRSSGENKNRGHRSKQPRLTQLSKSTVSTTISTVVTRARANSTGLHRKQTQGIASFMRQSKMSTSQKRSNPCTKSASKDPEDHSSCCQDDSELDSPCVLAGYDSALSGAMQEDEGEQVERTQEHDVGQDAQHSGQFDQEHSEKDRKDDAGGDKEVEEQEGDEDEEEDEEEEDDDEEDEYDHHNHDRDGLFSSGGSMSGMVSGASSKLKGILTSLRAYEDPSLQLIALQDLAMLLSMSTEENLAGYFSCDAFVKELVLLLRGTGDGDDNADIMLLACRCLSNLMEAMPASLGSVVYGGAVSVLCSKLIEIQYIDLAEQSLTTLEKISSEYPHAVVKEGGMAAVLMFLDFFPTNVQRTAVKTAANCCRGLHQDSINMVQDILPNLESLLRHTDEKIVEQACLCFVRLADSFKSNSTNLQTIITESVLRQILVVLSPSSKGVGSHVYTFLLHFLGTVAEHSPALGVALLEMDIVDTLFLILTGTQAPSSFGDEDGAVQVPNIGSRSKEQVSEILGIITELLPPLPKKDALFDTEYKYRTNKAERDNDKHGSSGEDVEMYSPPASSEIDRRTELLASHPERILRMGKILIPTLIEVYSSTVHLKVRQRAIHGLLRLMYFASDSILKIVLRDVELASFLAVVLSQQEHQSLVVAALQICDILTTKLPSLYRSYFEREGVTFEVSKLACLGVELSLSKDLDSTQDTEKALAKAQSSVDATAVSASETSRKSSSTDALSQSKDSSSTDSAAEDVSSVSAISQKLMRMMTELRNMRDQPDREQTMSEQLDAIESELEAAWSGSPMAERSDSSASGHSSRASGSTLEQLRTLQRFLTGGSRSVVTAQKDERGLGSGKTKDWIFERARILVETLQSGNVTKTGAPQGTSVLSDLKRIAQMIESPGVVKELAEYFTRVGATGITSFEFLSSGVSRALLEHLTAPDSTRTASQEERMRDFIQEFMTRGDPSNLDAVAPFCLLVKKMQETLTRMETFEVEAAQSSLGDARNNPSSSLATQVRLKLSPEHDTEAPSNLQNLVVSIHAIATFRTLDEYLRPHLMKKRQESEKVSSSPAPGKNGVPKDQGASDRPNDVPPTTRRSSRLQKLASPTSVSDENLSSDAERAPMTSKGNKQAESGQSEDSFDDSDEGDMEMECDFERRAGAHSTAGLETSSIDVDSDAKMDDDAQAKADAQPESTSDEHDSRRSRRGAKAPQKKTDGVSASSPSSSSWRIQFSLHGTPISTDTTVYGAIHEYERRSGKSASQRSMWSSIYPIKFKRVDSPAPEKMERNAHPQSPSDIDLTFTPQMPKELPQNADYVPILALLRVLHGLNDDWRRFCGSEEPLPMGTVQHLEPAEFVNSKISAKVNRQLEEPLIVASSCLPNWTTGLITGFPFLFPFETRYTYLQSTAFGFSRSIMRWQNQQQRNGPSDHRDDSQTFLGRIQRQKVRISRDKALESAVKVMDLYGASQGMLEVEYFDEVGTGLGPTLEFYSVVSKEFCKKSVKLWRDSDADAQSEYVLAPHGLFPRPISNAGHHSENDKKILKLFKSLGKFIAKAMLDSRIIDVPLSALLVDQLLGRSCKPRLQLISTIDPVLARSLQSLQSFVVEKKRVYSMNLPSRERENALKSIELEGSRLEDMSLDFTLPGYPRIELRSGGANIPVTIYNVEEYIQLTVDMTVGRGVQAQVAAFQEGFNKVFPIQDLAGFRSAELVNLFGSGEEDWSYETLMDSIKPDHGFGSDSPAFKNLLRVMSEFSKEERRQFLQFITGSPKLPIGGFKSLHPPFTVVCKHFVAPLKADDYLPSVMTCANYLKMPAYSCKEVTLTKFRMAYEEGQGSFHLS